MIQTRSRHSGDLRFGPKSDAEASLRQHIEVVGAVADRQRSLPLQTPRVAQGRQDFALGFLAAYGWRNASRQSAAFNFKAVGEHFVKIQSGADRGREKRKSTRHHCGVRAMLAHGGDETARSGIRR